VSGPSLLPPPEAWTVSETVARARVAIEDSFPTVRVKGEISRFVHHGSGHMYFTLKDSGAAISAAMFRGDNRRLRFRPKDGLEVLVEGRLSIYEARGSFQLIAVGMEPLGVGSLHLAFEQLKKRLAAEGLFDEERKRDLPLVPGRIGIATSPTGAAIRDMLRVLERRFANVHVLLAPCRVQGEGSAAEIAASIARLDRIGVDVIIAGRGGGSLEDLWAFNEESVARAILASGTPVVTGIGHEIDLTIADLVADRRAPTPSAAAEIVVQSKMELAGRLNALGRRLGGTARLAVARARERLRGLRDTPAMRDVPRRVTDAAQHLDDLSARAFRAVERRALARRATLELLRERLSPRALGQRVHERRSRLEHLRHRFLGAARASTEARRADVRRLADLLNSISPLAVLGRGYAICRDQGGAVVRSSGSVAAGDPVQVRLHRGELECDITRVVPPTPEEA